MPSWAKNAIEKLQNGECVVIFPRGNSMTPKIESGQRVEVVPCKIEELNIGDIVLCRVKGNDYLHLVLSKNDRVLIGNNHGRVNGWTSTVFGKVIKIGE